MPLFEYKCQSCSHCFEEIRGSSETRDPICPKCGSATAEKLVSRFAVAGQGDQRESTQHGCHDCHVSPGPAKSGDSGGDHHH